MLDDGNTKRYDTVTKTVEIIDRSGINIEPVRPATETDEQEYLLFFPEISIEKIQEINSFQSSVNSWLDNISNINFQEKNINELTEILISANNLIESYSKLSFENFESTKMIVSINKYLIEILVIILNKINYTATTTRNSIISYENRIQTIEARP